jgi:hypothetical protein
MKDLNSTSLALIKDLQQDLKNLLKCQSNIELVWELERLHKQNILSKTADLIRESLK